MIAPSGGQIVQEQKPLSANQRNYLTALSSCRVSIQDACKLTGTHRQTHYAWLKDSESYRVGYKEVQSAFNDSIEKEIHRRAVEGWDEPVFHQGICTGSKIKFSDILLIFMAKKRMPEYRDNYNTNISVTQTSNTLISNLSGPSEYEKPNLEQETALDQLFEE